jgi:pimeloyl-ACP methyl ester carboxylesterase
MSTRRTVRAAVATALAAGLLVAGAGTVAAADPDFTTIKGFKAPGTPAEYNRVGILKQGPADADKVLVLIPGTSGGAMMFRVMADALLARLDGWQVWSIDRRENLLEDHTFLQRYTAGQADAGQAVEYYLGGLVNPGQQPRFSPRRTDQTRFARTWGLDVAVEDVRRVVREARAGGRTVVLGGHSLGGSITTAYATWDFKGRPGAKDLDGLVFIDGAGGGRVPLTPREARKRLKDLRSGSPFLDLLGLGLPWATGVFNALGSTFAVKDPDAPSALQGFPLVPGDLKPPVPATNLGQYGYSVDAGTSPDYLRLVHSNIGRLAPAGEPRGWEDGELGGAARAAEVFAEYGPVDGTAWYHPVRLSLDAATVNNGAANRAQKVLGVKSTLGRKAKMPMYAFDAELGAGRVGRATRELAGLAGVPKREVITVNRSKTFAHIDPLSAAPETNAFVKTLARFLERHTR